MFEQQVKRIRPMVASIAARTVFGDAPATRDSDAVGALVAAIAAAARSAAARALPADDTPEADRKTAIDGAATDAAEAVFRTAGLPIAVVAGEGQRDASPGAYSGQSLGATGPSGWDGVFDYVDGTTLAARRLPGALSLGGLGHGLRAVPDLQAYAVLVPVELVDRVDIMSPPENHAAAVLSQVAEWSGRPVDDLVVLTHSVGSRGHHRSLIRLLTEAAGQVVVPDPVSIEPPHLLSLVGLTRPRIDTMLGAIGLCELAFAALLLDLVCPGYTFAFRMASIAGQRQRDADNLSPLWEFSPAETSLLNEAGWAVDRPYTAQDLVPRGGAEAAAIFSVTGEPALDLPVPGQFDTTGLLVERSHIARVVVTEVGGPEG